MPKQKNYLTIATIFARTSSDRLAQAANRGRTAPDFAAPRLTDWAGGSFFKMPPRSGSAATGLTSTTVYNRREGF
jgi:hypothetical protein